MKHSDGDAKNQERYRLTFANIRDMLVHSSGTLTTGQLVSIRAKELLLSPQQVCIGVGMARRRNEEGGGEDKRRIVLRLDIDTVITGYTWI